MTSLIYKLRQFFQTQQSSTAPVEESIQSAKEIDPETFAGIVRGVATTQDDELECDECFDQMDLLAELEDSGATLEEQLSKVQDHLARCGDCHEEYEALMTALKATA